MYTSCSRLLARPGSICVAINWLHTPHWPLSRYQGPGKKAADVWWSGGKAAVARGRQGEKDAVTTSTAATPPGPTLTTTTSIPWADTTTFISICKVDTRHLQSQVQRDLGRQGRQPKPVHVLTSHSLHSRKEWKVMLEYFQRSLSTHHLHPTHSTSQGYSNLTKCWSNWRRFRREKQSLRHLEMRKRIQVKQLSIYN